MLERIDCDFWALEKGRGKALLLKIGGSQEK
jgi:hypothetical protein